MHVSVSHENAPVESVAGTLATQTWWHIASVAAGKEEREGRLALLNLGGGREQYGGALD